MEAEKNLPKLFCAEKLQPEALAYLEGKVILTSPNRRPYEGEDLEPYLREAEGLINARFAVSDELLDMAPKLKVVSNVSVGYNNLDLNALRKRNILATHTPGVMSNSVADLIICLMIGSCRRAVELDRAIRNGEWTDDKFLQWFGTDITGAKLGIIGCGRIGRVLARKVKSAFDMDVAYCNRHRDLQAEETLGIRYEERDELLRTSDFVALLVPLTKENYHMMGKEQFKMMKNSAVFINTARGSLVNEPELIEALKSGEIRAAGLDCLEQEPTYKDNELLRLPNTFITPHIGSSTYATREAMVMMACKAAVDILYGRTPDCIVPEMK